MEEYLEILNRNGIFEDAIANTWEDLTLTGGREPESLSGIAVSGNTFAFLGVAPLLGRSILPSDAPIGAPAQNVAVLDYKTWMRRFGADAAAVGRAIQLNGRSYTVIGVMPSRFGWRGADVWIPLAIDRANPRMVSVRGRLKPGMTLPRAAENLRTIHQHMAREHPREYPREGFTIHMYSLTDGVIGQFRTTLYILFGAVTLLLLIACANVANLQLVKATQRSREMAIRTALGAGPWRLARQLLIESLLLAGIGAAAGVALAIWGTHLLVMLMPPFGIPNEARIAINGRVLLFSTVLALASGVLFGIAPALAAARPDLNQGLKEGARGSGEGRRWRTRSALVIVEMALALMLLVGAGLMLRSFAAYRDTDLGFRPENILTARIPLPAARYPRPDQRNAFYRSLLERLGGLQGVEGASVSSGLPPRGGFNSAFEIEGRRGLEQARTAVQLVSRDYFRTLRIPLLRGRLFDSQEEVRAEQVALISEFMAARFFAGDNPQGKRLRLELLERLALTGAARDPWVRIVGVVGTVKNNGIQEDPRPAVYLPYSVIATPFRVLALRTAQKPLALASAVRAQVAAVDKDQVVSDISTVEQELKNDESRPRFSTVITVVFALTGLLLAGIGTFSVIAYTYARRTQEIGLRMALGAQESHILWMVLRSGLQLALGGVSLGVLGAWSLTRFIAHLLYKVSPADPWTFCAACTVLTGAALAACYVPARRAARTNPQAALRRW
jgi:predicted permease